MVIVVTGILLPWFAVAFEVTPVTFIRGWGLVYLMVDDVLESLLENRFELSLIPSAIIAAGGVLISLYLIYNLFEIIREERSSMSRVAIPAILIGVNVIFLFPVLFLRSLMFARLLPGYWWFVVGVLSCVILEWIKVKRNLR